jgi:hypothetical protein
LKNFVVELADASVVPVDNDKAICFAKKDLQFMSPMRHVIFLFLTALFVTSCSETSSQSDFKPDVETERKLQSLFDKREYFTLNDILRTCQDKIPPEKYEFFSAVVQNAFNQNIVSIETINNLLKSEHELLPSFVAELMLLQRDNYIKIFDYKNAAATGTQVIERFTDLFDEKKIHAIKNKNTIYQGLAATPSQKTVVSDNAVINYKKDKIGLMTVPVSTGSETHDFVFDTRAGISVIMKSYAEKLKLRMPGVRYLEGSGITGKTFEAELGIADSLVVGNIKMYNVVFQVLPDEILSFPSINYSLNGIIGFPVIVQWRRFRINKSGTIVVRPESDTVSPLHNLAFDEAAIVLRTRADDDTLSFYLDSGANHSELFSNYFVEKESLLKQIARIDTVEVGGVGGMKKRRIYTLPTLTLQIGNKTAALNDVQVLTTPTYPGQKYYGNLGQDLLTQFEEITLDFDAMSLSFR